MMNISSFPMPKLGITDQTTTWLDDIKQYCDLALPHLHNDDDSTHSVALAKTMLPSQLRKLYETERSSVGNEHLQLSQPRAGCWDNMTTILDTTEPSTDSEITWDLSSRRLAWPRFRGWILNVRPDTIISRKAARRRLTALKFGMDSRHNFQGSVLAMQQAVAEYKAAGGTYDDQAMLDKMVQAAQKSKRFGTFLQFESMARAESASPCYGNSTKSFISWARRELAVPQNHICATLSQDDAARRPPRPHQW
jgi:hypothetical protein